MGKQTKPAQLQVSDYVIKQYVARCKEGGCDALLTPEEQSGKPQKASQHAVNIVKQDLKKYPTISAWIIKESNNRVFGEVSNANCQPTRA